MPTSVKSGYSATSSAYTPGCTPKPKDALIKVWKFCRRLLYVRQMDFQYALWQVHKLLTSPQKLYVDFQYRKTTKGQFARDDPAFLVMLAITFVILTLSFGILTSLPVKDMLFVMFWLVGIDCIGCGMLVATFFWFIGNKFLLSHPRSRGNDLEWGFCFDVHLNSFYPFLIILHGAQLPFLWLINGSQSILPIILGNSFWMASLTYYWYITFLGYNIQPNLQKSTVYLLPLVPIALAFVLSCIFHLNWTSGMVWFYQHRIGHTPSN